MHTGLEQEGEQTMTSFLFLGESSLYMEITLFWESQMKIKQKET